jgi:hypothetical protein
MDLDRFQPKLILPLIAFLLLIAGAMVWISAPKCHRGKMVSWRTNLEQRTVRRFWVNRTSTQRCTNDITGFENVQLEVRTASNKVVWRQLIRVPLVMHYDSESGEERAGGLLDVNDALVQAFIPNSLLQNSQSLILSLYRVDTKQLLAQGPF